MNVINRSLVFASTWRKYASVSHNELENFCFYFWSIPLWRELYHWKREMINFWLSFSSYMYRCYSVSSHLALNSNIKIHILICYPTYTFSTEEVGRNYLSKYQLDSSCVIMSLILMTTLFYKAVILQGEIWHWSTLLVLKGLKGP